MARTTPMRIEPKTFFANERTFLSWLHMAVTIGSIAAALLGFVGVADSSKHKAQVSCFLKSASWIVIAALCCWLSMLLNLQCDWVLQTHLVPLLLSDYFPLWCVPPVSLLYLLCIFFSTVFDCNIASFPVFLMFCRCIPHGFSVCHLYIGVFPPVFSCAFGWIICWNGSSGIPSNHLHINHLCLCWHLVFSLLMMPPCAILTGHRLPGGNHRADPAAGGCDDVRLRAHRLHLARACHIQEAGALSGPDLPNTPSCLSGFFLTFCSYLSKPSQCCYPALIICHPRYYQHSMNCCSVALLAFKMACNHLITNSDSEGRPLKRCQALFTLACQMTAGGQFLLPVASLQKINHVSDSHACRSAQVGHIDDRFGPLGLAGVVVLALTAILIISIVDFVQQMQAKDGPPPAPPAPTGPLPDPTSLRSDPFGLQRAF